MSTAQRVAARYQDEQELDHEAGELWLTELEENFEKTFPKSLLRMMDREITLRGDELTWRWATTGGADITVDLKIVGGRRPYIFLEYEFADDDRDQYDTDNEDYRLDEDLSPSDIARSARGFFREMATVARKYEPGVPRQAMRHRVPPTDDVLDEKSLVDFMRQHPTHGITAEELASSFGGHHQKHQKFLKKLVDKGTLVKDGRKYLLKKTG